MFDYKLVWKYSLRALKNYRKDSRALRNANVILTDTYAHKTYFSDTFNIPHSKMHVLPIGILSHDFIAQEKPHTDVCTVGFYGGFIPLQGVRHIIETARIMQKYSDIKFELVGNGFEYDTMRKLAESYKLSNIYFIGWVSFVIVRRSLRICLGIFGDTHKANIVIPNKIYHYAAMKKAIITKKTDAIQELFTHTKDCILCNSNPLEIADCILNLKEQYIQKEQIAQNAHALITQNYNEQAIARMFVSIITNTCL